MFSVATQTEPALFEILELLERQAPENEEENEDIDAVRNAKSTQTENFKENTPFIQNDLLPDKLKEPEKQAVSTNAHIKSQKQNNLPNELQSSDLNSQDVSRTGKNHKNLVSNMILAPSLDKPIFQNNSKKVLSFDDIRIEDIRRNVRKKEEIKETLKNAGLFVVKTALVSGGILGGVAIALPLAGFTSAGVAAGSMAAAYQSTLGGYIASGSTFAVCQSIGAAGLSASTQAVIVAGSAALVKAKSVLSKFW